MRAGIAEGRRQAFARAVTSARSTWLDRQALARIRESVASAPLSFELWDGFVIAPVPGPPVATIVFKSRRALISWVWNPDLHFGEAYMFGEVEIRGDLVATLEAVYRALASRRQPWYRRQPANGRAASKEHVHHHYDLGNDFYGLWLDRELVYTCAYFPTPDSPLEEAQTAKMDRVCRKLRLRAGETVVEAGCGWGALALYMAKTRGVSVRAFNISSEQIAYARSRARAEGIADRVEFVEGDYREVRGTYDVFVSVGMLEHVGRADLSTLGRVIGRALGADGRGLLHFIGRDRPMPLNPWIRKRIFPGAYPPALREVFEQVLEPHDLSVYDVENLRRHYARTLEHWRQRFERSADRVRERFDEPFVRAWRLYLAGSEAAFTTGAMHLFQVVFARAGTDVLPWTRAV